VLIAKNEVSSLPRLLSSLSDFQARQGEVVLVDTGSTDGTPDKARSLGCIVFEVGDQFITTINTNFAKQINHKFVVGGEAPVVNPGDKIFNFSAARNFAASCATTDYVSFADCDEKFTTLDIDAINELIQKGIGQFEYNFCFSHDQFGNPAMKFIQSKFYDRRLLQWRNIVHEVLSPRDVSVGDAKRALLPESTLYLEHWQEPNRDHRPKYLVGLAYDAFMNPSEDRQSHYLGRELLWTGHPKSAIHELTRHVAMNRWDAERAQSLIFMGDAYGIINQPEKQVEAYNKAFYIDCSRRESLLRLANFYKHNQNFQATACYASAALEIPWNGYYANDHRHYTSEPHALLYWANGWMGKIDKAKEHLMKALEYEPFNPDFHRDTRFYFAYADPCIEGWMTYSELLWLYETASTVQSIVELGSWQGKSTHALCSGCPHGLITAIDHFQGSDDERDLTKEAAKTMDVYGNFLKNMAPFRNIKVNAKNVEWAAGDYPDGAFDMVFIDAEHSYSAVRRDIRLWKPKARKILCGHDYSDTWPELKQAVKDELGEVEVHATIWIKRFNPPTLTIDELTDKIRNKIPFSFVKRGDGEQACMRGDTGQNVDGQSYSIELAEKLRESFRYLQGRAYVVDFDNQQEYNMLLHRTDSNLDAVKNFWMTVKDRDPKKKVFVGPIDLYRGGVGDLLQIEKLVAVSPHDAFGQNSSVMQSLVKCLIEIGDDVIFIFCAGLASKVWIAELMKIHPVTCIDAGSSFDPIFLYQSRTYQADRETLHRLYGLSETPQSPVRVKLIKKEPRVSIVKEPMVSIVIPTVQPERKEKWLRLLAHLPGTVGYQNYEVITMQDSLEDRKGCPVMVAQGVEKATGELILFLGDDVVPEQNFLRYAVDAMIKHFPDFDGLIGLNDGNWGDRLATHWLAGKKLLPLIGGEFFHTGYNHVGCDNELTGRARKLGKYFWCKESMVQHHHPLHTGHMEEMDEVYKVAWNEESVRRDRELLKQRSEEFGFELIV
jgi:glycosyltransferase involved in cell wall biosynthesis